VLPPQVSTNKINSPHPPSPTSSPSPFFHSWLLEIPRRRSRSGRSLVRFGCFYYRSPPWVDLVSGTVSRCTPVVVPTTLLPSEAVSSMLSNTMLFARLRPRREAVFCSSIDQQRLCSRLSVVVPMHSPPPGK
jgi:hypothetical protein